MMHQRFFMFKNPGFEITIDDFHKLKALFPTVNTEDLMDVYTAVVLEGFGVLDVSSEESLIQYILTSIRSVPNNFPILINGVME